MQYVVDGVAVMFVALEPGNDLLGEPGCGRRLRMRRDSSFPPNWVGCLQGAAFARGVLTAREVAEREGGGNVLLL